MFCRSNELKKKVVITGSTGGLGSEMAKLFLKEGYDLLLLNRSKTKTIQQIADFKKQFSDSSIDYLIVDFSKMEEVKNICEKLMTIDFNTIVLNAAIYNVKVEMMDTNYNNIFQVNFISPYYMLKKLKQKPSIEKFIVIGSVAHKFAKLLEDDIDYSNHTKINQIYGNSKRFLMFAAYELFKNDNRLLISHPGIVYTNITNHFHPAINWFITFWIRLIFPNKKHAAKVLISKKNKEIPYLYWVGPRIFGLWGKAGIKKIKKIKNDEIIKISKIAERIYGEINED